MRDLAKRLDELCDALPLTTYTDHVPAALPDGTPGFAAYQLIGRMARLCYDSLG